jgi:multisubunit Na+/H+ antiporter MnhB subunit
MSDALEIAAIAVTCLVAFHLALAVEGSPTGATVSYRRVRHFVRVLAAGFVTAQFLHSLQAPDAGFLATLLAVVGAMYGTHRLSLYLDRALLAESGRRAG